MNADNVDKDNEKQPSSKVTNRAGRPQPGRALHVYLEGRESVEIQADRTGIFSRAMILIISL